MFTQELRMPTSLSPVERPVRRRTMKAAIITAPQKLQVADAPVPEPGDGQVRVSVEGCGVCASNIPPWEGRPWFKYPMAPGQLGHEGWGTIDAVGANVTGFREGDRVAFLSNHAYAEFDVVDAGSMVRLPDLLCGNPFPAEPLGCSMNVLKRSDIQRGQTVAILGVGFLGAVMTRMASVAGATVIGISRRPQSLEVARQMGAAHTFSIDDPDLVQHIAKLTAGKFCDRVIEATGKQKPLDLAAEITRERGRMIIAGYHQDGLRTVNMQLWNWRGLDVINGHEREPQVYVDGMREAVDAVASGLLDPSRLYTHRYRLEQLGEALEATRLRPDGFMKALVIHS
jgi:threonine dehydrogenase-like Zn-dependent dehydrogenase